MYKYWQVVRLVVQCNFVNIGFVLDILAVSEGIGDLAEEAKVWCYLCCECVEHR